MPIEMRKEPAGWYLVRVSGTLVKQDYNAFEPLFRQMTGSQDKLRMLVDMTALQGWEPAAFWEEIKFDIKHLERVERLAVVGSKHWQHAMASFADVFVRAQVRYFESGQEQAAETWLQT
ncbi:MAG: STAS/SEC14 domain-containing protein [Acidobacteriota bacterium]